MLGSSRSLLKALEVKFNECEENEKEIDNKYLFEVISSFNEKHNTLQSIKSSVRINDELVRIYNTYIMPSSNLQKEILFVEVIASLSPFFKREDTEFWLKTYLRPAVDSAGFDLKFISKSRDFIRRISIDNMPTDDAALKERRKEASMKVMDHIMQICIRWRNPPKILNLDVSEEAVGSQEHYERLRFIRYNSIIILREYSLAKPDECFDLLDTYFKQADDRLEACVLLADLISIEAPPCSDLIRSRLFHSLIECLHFDFSESVLLVALTCLLMLIPHICTELADYLPDIIHVYERMVSLSDIKRSFPSNVDLVASIIAEKDLKWAILPFDNQLENPSSSAYAARLEFYTKHLLTLVYALYPLNLREYNKSPRKYFKTNRPKVLNSFILETFNSMLVENYDPLQTSLESCLKERTSKFLKSVLLHPKLVSESQSLNEELHSPLAWIIEDEGEDFSGPEEIAIKCFSLNPSLETNTEQRHLTEDSVQDSNSTRGYCQSMLGFHAFDAPISGNWDLMNTSPIDSRQISRVSSLGNTNLLGSRDEHKTHKSSSKLYHQRSSFSSGVIHDNVHDSEIRFKEVKFDKGIESEPFIGSKEHIRPHNSVEYIPRYIQDVSADDSSLSSNDRKPSEPIDGLLSVHEKLYSSPRVEATGVDHSAKTSLGLGNVINERMKNDFHLQRPVSSPTTSLETTQVHRDSIAAFSDSQTTKISNSKDNSGTVLDFYHRELLLLKNELCFAFYMRNLNKYYYTVLKLQLNNLVHNGHKFSRRDESSGYQFEFDAMKQAKDGVSESLLELRTEMEEEKKRMESSLNKTVEQLGNIKKVNQRLTQKIRELESSHEVTSKSLDKLVNGEITSKNIEINDLKNKIDFLQIDLNKAAKARTVAPSEESVDAGVVNDVSEWEEKVVFLKEEMKLLNKKNQDLEVKLKTAQSSLKLSSQTYETKLKSSKLDIKDNVNSFIIQYEKKVQELSSTIIRYEALLNEKNSILLRFSSSKPMSIPRKSLESDHGNFNGHQSTIRTPVDDIQDPINMAKDKGDNSIDSSNSRSPNQTPIPSPYSHSGYTSSSIPVNHTTNSQSTLYQPIIKGRGGYQKRSKKHM